MSPSEDTSEPVVNQEPPRPSGPLHGAAHPTSYWTTSNVGEAMPGVLTPLGWSVWGTGCERGARETFVRLGVLERARAGAPPDERDRLMSIFYGRVAAHVNFMAEMGDRLPGTSGRAVVEQYLGSAPPDLPFRPTRRRYAFVAARMPIAFATVLGRMRAEHRAVAQWWPAELRRTPELSLDEARRQFTSARHRFDRAVTLQSDGMFIGVQPVFDQLLTLIERADAQELADALMGGGGSHVETEIVQDLWDLARDTITMRTFLARHGYHGPMEGEISGRVWREDPTPVLKLAEQYRNRDDAADPAALAHARATERIAAEKALVASLPATRRPAARAVLALARRNLPMRGIGKATFLRSLDIARAAARRTGDLLTESGVLSDPEDVFYLTATEISGELPADVAATVAERRRQRAEFASVTLPTHWQGEPRPCPSEEPPAASGPVRLVGVSGSGGVVKGRIRVVTDPTFTDVEPDEIIVATTTDPSWSSILFISKALVVDIGGPLSHAAVVARELGIPCVMNTGNGTRLLRTGDVCVVDGTNGTVDVI